MVEKFKNLNSTSRRVLSLLRKAERLPENRHEHFQYIIDKLPHPAAIICDGRCEQVNLAFTRIFGYTAADLNDAKPLLESWPTLPAESEIKTSPGPDGESPSQRFDMIDSGGTLIRNQVTVARISYLGNDGTLVLFRRWPAGADDDPTAIDDASRASENETPRRGDWHYQVPEKRFLWSRDLYELFGRSPGEFRPSLTQLWNYIHDDDREKGRLAFERAVTAGSSIAIELRVILDTGIERIFRVVAGAHRDDAGAIARVIGTMTDVTERRLSEQRLRMLSMAVEQSDEGMATIDLNGTVLFSNAVFARMHGYEPAEIIGRHVSLFHTPEQLPAIEQALEINVATGTFQGEVWHVKKDGTVFPTFMNNSLLRDEEGQPIGILGTLHDITEQKEAEERLRQSEETYRNLFHNAQVGLFRTSIEEGTILESNDQMARMFGYSSRESFLHKFDTRNHYVDPTLRDRIIATLLEKGEAHRIDAEFTRHDGSTFWARYSARIYPEHGWIEGVMEDITEQRRVEGELAKAQALLMAAIEQSPAGILIADAPNVRIRMANAAALGIRGVGASDLIDIPVEFHPGRWQTFHPDGTAFAPEDLPLSRAVLRGEVVHNAEVIIRRSNDEDRFVLANASPVRDSSGVVVAGVVVFLDITERRLAEEKLRDSEERFRNAFMTSPDAVNLNRLSDGVFVDINDGFSAITGYTRDEVIGRSSLERDIWHVAADRERLVQRLLKQGTVDNMEAKFRCKDGRVLSGLMSARLIALGGVPHIMSITRDITEWRKAEEERQKSEALYHTLFDAANDAILIMSGTRFIDCNRKAEEVFGRSRADIIDHSPVEFSPEFQADGRRSVEVAEEMIRAAYAGEPQSFEWLHSRPMGGLINSEVSLTIMRLGDETYVMAIVRDITERRNAESTLRFTQYSIDHSADAAFWMEPDGRIIYVNEAACTSLEYTREELQSMSVQDIDPNFPRSTWGSHWETVKQQTSVNIESQHRTKSGRLIPVEVAINHVEFEGREYHCAFVRDISRRKAAQQALADSERLLATILSNLPGMAYSCRNDGKWTMEFVSDGCKDLTGFGNHHLRGKKRDVYEGLVHSEDRSRLRRDVKKALSERMPYTIEYRITTVHDEEKWVWEQGRGVYDDSGQPIAMEGIITDITAMKKLELELRTSTESLRTERQALQEKNIALNQFLEHLDDRKRAFQHQISADIQMELVPVLERLSEQCESAESKRITKTIDNIKIILSKNVDEFKVRFARLSPREVEISTMIARGMTTKEISEKLVLSPFTVHKHRELIRRKLEIANKGINLSTYLKSHLSDQLRIF